MERIPRVKWQKKQMISRALALLFFALFVAGNLIHRSPLSGSDFDVVPIVFFAIYFGILAWMMIQVVAAFQSLEIDREEIRVYIGPLRIRRIPVNAIKSVFRAAKYGNNGDREPLYVIMMLFETPKERRERGERPLLSASFWIEDSEQTRLVLARMLPRSVVNL